MRFESVPNVSERERFTILQGTVSGANGASYHKTAHGCPPFGRISVLGATTAATPRLPPVDNEEDA